jgi:hypothetical protein
MRPSAAGATTLARPAPLIRLSRAFLIVIVVIIVTGLRKVFLAAETRASARPAAFGPAGLASG